MKKKHLVPVEYLALLVLFSLLLAACGGQSVTTISSSGARAWLDQPWDGVTIPLAPYTLKAHARMSGGGVSAIKFKVNDIEVGNVTTDSTLALAYAETPWNPAAPGPYLIQAIAVTTSGETGSEIARVCVGQDEKTDCGGAAPPQTGGNQPSKTLDTKMGASPDPVYYGQCTAGEPTTFMLDVALVNPPATTFSVVKAVYTYTGPSGTSYPFSSLLVDKGSGIYAGSVTVATEAQSALGGAEGTITYFIAFTGATADEVYQSQSATLQIKPCGAGASGTADVKIGASPNPVWYGTCLKGEPQVVNFEAAFSDPALVTEAALAYHYLDAGGNALTSDMNIAMTPIGSGGFIYAVSLPETAPAGMAGGGTLVYTAFGYDASKNMVAKSDPGYISVYSCQAPQQITTEAPPPPPVITTTVPPAPPTIITTVAPPPPPKDTTPPTITKFDVNPTTAYYVTDCGTKGADTVTVSVYAYDDSGIKTIYVWYRYLPSAGVRTVDMYSIGGDRYEAKINVAGEAYSELGGGNGTLDMAVYAVDGEGNQGVAVSPVAPQVLYCPG